MKPNQNWPIEVFRQAHKEYPNAVASANLFGAAFFGHSNPEGVTKTCESIWRGLCRKALNDFCA